uniref:Pre-mRNA 3'-end-processing factor FIP1 n=1 Tax=Anthurium amnicola TaxID=1678845 RepID=A0A1D1XLV6_9ARAE
MDDDDEFGDLYTDVLRLPPGPAPPPLDGTSASIPATTSKPPSPFNPRSDSDDDGSRDRSLPGAPGSGRSPSSLPSQLPAQSGIPDSQEGGDEDWVLGQAPASQEQPVDWDDGEDEGLPRVSSAEATDLVPGLGVSRVLLEEEGEDASGFTETLKKQVGEDEEGIRVAEGVEASTPGKVAAATLDIHCGIADLDEQPVIPGLSVAPLPPEAFHDAESGDGKVSRSGDWDSDSEDDLQIVLNDDNLIPTGGDGNVGFGIEDDADEDGEDDLVIVTDEDQHNHHHHHLGMEEQDLDGESMQQPFDGERKEKLDVANGNGGTVALAKIGYNSHGYHGQHQSQFKYIRPGVAAITGGAAAGTGAASGQLRPPLTMGPMAGRGRGAQKSFHSGYGLQFWSSNASARAFGGGLEFTLPSHKTIFDMDIDDFEEKPWRLPGVDMSDFFNFGLTEDKWRDVCKQLEQLRLESTMQSKIRVYESGRSEKDYDPDLPPELAAAVGIQDISAESIQGKADGGQPDLISQGRGALGFRPQFPIGRAIQVESGFGERLPSIDTRPPRIRDSDAIIEIVLQDSVDVCSGVSDPHLFEPEGQDVEGDDEHEDGDKGSMGRNASEGNGILPLTPDASSKCLPTSKSQTPEISGDHYDASHAARRTQSSKSVECSNDAIASQNVKLEIYEAEEGRLGDNMEDKDLPIAPLETAVEVNFDQRSDEHNERLALDDGAEIEEETASDLRLSGKCHGDNTSYHAVKKQKLSSQVEQLGVQDKDYGNGSRATHSDNGRAKTGSSKDHLNKHEGGEEEVVQSGRSRLTVDQKGHHHEEERSFQQVVDNGRDGRHDTNRSHIASKGREDVYQSRPHRERDSTNYGRRREGFERGKERDGIVGGCLGREDDAHRKRGKDEGRKRDIDDEIGSRHRSKVRAGERNGKDEDLHSRKSIGNGDRKGRNDRDGAPRQRDRDDTSMSRHENFDALHIKRRKDEEQPRREKIEKEDVLHGRKGRDGTTHAQRERENGVNHKSREDQTRVRDRVEDHLTKHRDDNLRHREREDRRLNKPNEVTRAHKEREKGHAIGKGGRVLEDKSVGGIERVNNLSKGLGSDDHPPKERRRHGEQRDHFEEHTRAQHETRQKLHAHENQLNNREKISKNERVSSRSNHPLAASDSQLVHRERHRENSRQNKEIKGGEPSYPATGKRRHEDQRHHLNGKVGARGTNEQEGSNTSSDQLSKRERHLTDKAPGIQEQHHISGDHAEEDAVSDDDSNQNVRRGRSKLERWTSHIERDFSNSNNSPQPLPSRVRESEVCTVNIIELADVIKTEGNDDDTKVSEAMQIDHRGEERDCHLDAVAKLKQRSERFKLPEPGEDSTIFKKPEDEVPPIQGDVTDADIKQERPARKRRWTGS